MTQERLRAQGSLEIDTAGARQQLQQVRESLDRVEQSLDDTGASQGPERLEDAIRDVERRTEALRDALGATQRAADDVGDTRGLERLRQDALDAERSITDLERRLESARREASRLGGQIGGIQVPPLQGGGGALGGLGEVAGTAGLIGLLGRAGGGRARLAAGVLTAGAAALSIPGLLFGQRQREEEIRREARQERLDEDVALSVEAAARRIGDRLLAEQVVTTAGEIAFEVPRELGLIQGELRRRGTSPRVEGARDAGIPNELLTLLLESRTEGTDAQILADFIPRLVEARRQFGPRVTDRALDELGLSVVSEATERSGNFERFSQALLLALQQPAYTPEQAEAVFRREAIITGAQERFVAQPARDVLGAVSGAVPVTINQQNEINVNQIADVGAEVSEQIERDLRTNSTWRVSR